MHLTLCFSIRDKFPGRRFIDWIALLREYTSGGPASLVTWVLDEHRRSCARCDAQLTAFCSGTDSLQSITFTATPRHRAA